MSDLLHVPTLLLATGLVVGVAGLLLIVAAGGNPRARAFRTWGAAMLLGAGGLGVLAARDVMGSASEIIGTTMILGATALSWGASRRLFGRVMMPGVMLVGPAFYLGSALEPLTPATLDSTITLTVGGLYTMATAFELWRNRAGWLPARDAAMVLTAVHGTLHLGRGVSLLLAGRIPAFDSPAATAAMMVETLIHAVAMALLLFAMLKERTGEDRLREALELAMHDGLTGLSNRRHFDQTMEREVAQAARKGHHLALLMIDADYFKGINDSLGHAGGDECLRALAGAIRTGLRRPADFVARFGGEEFAVLLPDTSEAGAEDVAGQIHKAIADLHMPHPTSPTGSVTVSIGIAVLTPGPGAFRPAPLLLAADNALYAAKTLGRNRTEVAPLPPGGAVAERAS